MRGNGVNLVIVDIDRYITILIYIYCVLSQLSWQLFCYNLLAFYCINSRVVIDQNQSIAYSQFGLCFVRNMKSTIVSIKVICTIIQR